jgi:dTDP-4-amino-4,6-dideoxygalactose transaminase
MIEVYAPTVRRKEMDAVLTALVEDKIGPGARAELLIQTAKEHIGFDYSLSVRSPAIALFFALKLLDIEDGKSVIISALSPRYYLNVIEDLRLRPVVCDVAPGSSCMDRERVQAVLSPDTRAIVVHHTLGYAPDTVSIAETGLPVIEDCSQSYGTFIGEKLLPSAGIFTILGLEEKDMLTSGGGALLYAMNRRDASVLRSCGSTGAIGGDAADGGSSSGISGNTAGTSSGRLPAEYGLPDMNATMAVVQFREAAKNFAKRKEIAEIYIQAALRTRHKRFVQREDAPYNNFAFPLILETGMKDVRAYAKKKDIAVESAFTETIVGCGSVAGQCPEAYSLSLRTALFPLYPRLRASEIEKVSKLIGTLP